MLYFDIFLTLRLKTSSRALNLWLGSSNYIGRRLSILSMDESVDVRPFPLSLTRSVMRMLGLVDA